GSESNWKYVFPYRSRRRVARTAPTSSSAGMAQKAITSHALGSDLRNRPGSALAATGTKIMLTSTAPTHQVYSTLRLTLTARLCAQSFRQSQGELGLASARDASCLALM